MSILNIFVHPLFRKIVLIQGPNNFANVSIMKSKRYGITFLGFAYQYQYSFASNIFSSSY